MLPPSPWICNTTTFHEITSLLMWSKPPKMLASGCWRSLPCHSLILKYFCLDFEICFPPLDLWQKSKKSSSTKSTQNIINMDHIWVLCKIWALSDQCERSKSSRLKKWTDPSGFPKHLRSDDEVWKGKIFRLRRAKSVKGLKHWLEAPQARKIWGPKCTSKKAPPYWGAKFITGGLP